MKRATDISFQTLSCGSKKIIDAEGNTLINNLTANGDVIVVGNITADKVTANTIVRPLAVPAATVAQQRQDNAYSVRVNAAYQQYIVPLPTQSTNGDEAEYSTKIGNYSKGLPHNSLGEVSLSAYAKLITAVTTGDSGDFAAIPMGNAHAKLTNPQSGLSYSLEGADCQALFETPPPAVASAQRAAEAVEDYWAALVRDVEFSDYGSDDTIANACAELSGLSGYTGPTPVTPANIFRSNIIGSVGGPFISQFLLQVCPFGATEIDQKIYTIDPVATGAQGGGVPSSGDFGTIYNEWLDIQNGTAPTHVLIYDETKRYIRNGRDLAQWVHMDLLYQAYFQAMCILIQTPGLSYLPATTAYPVNIGNPYNTIITNQSGFGTFGGPHIASLMCEAATRALKAQWFQKWFVHRCLRPEAYGGLVHNTKIEAATYPVHPDALNSAAVAATFDKFGTYLLPQAFPEYSPYHPSYGSGHATVGGACVTILKAFFNGAAVIQNPVQVVSNGTDITSYDGAPLTVEGELNKLAYNVAFGRCFAGIHYRSDSDQSLLLGEAVAISILRDQQKLYNEPFAGFTFNKFDGTTVTI